MNGQFGEPQEARVTTVVIVFSKLPTFPHAPQLDICIRTIKHEPIIVNKREGGGELSNTCL